MLRRRPITRKAVTTAILVHAVRRLGRRPNHGRTHRR